MKKYVIVNAINGVPIRRPGFCSTFTSQSEAKRNCENWNKLAASYNLCKAIVKEMER